MTDKEVFDFCWDWKRNWFDTDVFLKRLEWNRCDLVAFAKRAESMGMWSLGMDRAVFKHEENSKKILEIVSRET